VQISRQEATHHVTMATVRAPDPGPRVVCVRGKAAPSLHGRESRSFLRMPELHRKSALSRRRAQTNRSPGLRGLRVCVQKVEHVERESQVRFGEVGGREGVLGSWADDEGGVVWEAQAIADAVKGKVVAEGGAGSVCTDTRNARRGQWFLALTGPNFDGHGFLQQACEQQCAGVVANWVPRGWSRGFVQVEGDTLRALQAMAADVRGRFWGPVVGITGSVGKTTARAMTTLALRGLNGHVHEAQGNFNNHIGVPLTLLKLPSRSVACVLELGMNHAGEILELAEIAKPDVRVLLNVGPAHMENFPGGLGEVAAAKGEIFQNAHPGDVCVVNADDPLAMALPLPAGVRVVGVSVYSLPYTNTASQNFCNLVA
jgi:hypothetical protein